MTLDAASSTCCCGNVPGECCYPIASATMQITVVEKFKHLFDGQILDQTMSSLSTTVTFTRQQLPLGMVAVCTNTAAYEINSNTAEIQPSFPGTSCPGETDYYQCLPCKPPHPACLTTEYRMPEGLQATCYVNCASCRNIFSEPVGSTYDRPMTTISIGFPADRNITITGHGSGSPGDPCVGSGTGFSNTFFKQINCSFYDKCFTLEALRENMYFHLDQGEAPAIAIFRHFTNAVRCINASDPYRPQFPMCGNSIYSTGGALYSNMGVCPNGFNPPAPCQLVRDTPSNQLLPLKNLYLSTCNTADCGQPYQCYYVDCFGQLLYNTQSCGCDSILGYDDGVTQVYYTDGWGTSAQGFRQYTYEREIFVTVS